MRASPSWSSNQPCTQSPSSPTFSIGQLPIRSALTRVSKSPTPRTTSPLRAASTSPTQADGMGIELWASWSCFAAVSRLVTMLTRSRPGFSAASTKPPACFASSSTCDLNASYAGPFQTVPRSLAFC
ncbi:hypothetical protein DLE60_03845 [Micromonospora globispora]|nr:hypothetical protein DLE60_03845 [Micromonospora globispora]